MGRGVLYRPAALSIGAWTPGRTQEKQHSRPTPGNATGSAAAVWGSCSRKRGKHWAALPSWRRRRRERRVITRSDNSLFDTCVCKGITKKYGGGRAEKATICTGKRKGQTTSDGRRYPLTKQTGFVDSSGESWSHGRVNGTAAETPGGTGVTPYHANLAPSHLRLLR